METIIYFEKKRGLQEPVIDPVGMKTYLLVRVSLDVERDRWFETELRRPQTCESGKSISPAEGTVTTDVSDAMFGADTTNVSDVNTGPDGTGLEPSRRQRFFAFRHLLEARRKRQQMLSMRNRELERRYSELRECHRQWDLWRERIRMTEAAINSMMTLLMTFQEPREPIYAVYGEEMREILRSRRRTEFHPGEQSRIVEEFRRPDCGKDILSDLWFRSVTIPEFTAYDSPVWMERMLENASDMRKDFPQHVYIIGRNYNVCRFLEENCSRLKTVCWRVPERERDDAFEEYLENYYEDCGLVINCRTYSDMSMLCRETIVCPDKTLLFDFSGEEYVPNMKLPKGSLWLDICSGELKQKKVCARNPAVNYISLKTIWKQAQKRRNKPFFLDITEGNGYNTWESEGIIEPK